MSRARAAQHEPQTVVQLLAKVVDLGIGDWGKTFQLVVLMVVPAVTLLGGLFILQLNPVYWISVLVSAASIFGLAKVRRRSRLGANPALVKTEEHREADAPQA